MKYIRFCAIVCTILLLTGCGIFTAKQTDTVAIFARDLQQDSMEHLRASALQQALADAGYAVQVFDAKNDQAVQTEQLEKILQEGCAGVIIQPVIMSAVEQLLEQVKAADVPVIFTGKPVEEEVLHKWDKTGYVGADPEQLGMRQGSILAQLPNKGDINGDGYLSYVLVWDLAQYADTQLHTAGVFSELTDAQINLMQLGLCNTEGDPQKAYQGCATLIAEYGKDIEAVICSSDALALGALEAITEGGRTVGENIYLFGIGGDEDALKAVEDGVLTGTVREDTDALTQNVIQLLKQLEKGEAQQRTIEISCVPVAK